MSGIPTDGASAAGPSSDGATGPAGPPTERRPSLGRALRGVVLGLLAVGPFAFALATPEPHVEASPRTTPSAVEALPALPTGRAQATLASELEPVPMLVEVPDEASNAAVDAFAAAGILEPDEVRAAFSSAWEALASSGANPSMLRSVERRLLNPGISELPTAFDDLVAALVHDHDNGGRLVNAATMLFAYGALLDSGVATTPDDAKMGYPFHGAAIEVGAAAMLEAVGRAFGPSLAQLVNQAVITSVTNYQTGRAEAVALVDQAIELEPDNVTVRLLLAELQANQPDNPTAWRAAPATLAPLLDDPATELVGHAGLGDAYLLAASLRRLEAPRTARVLARRAIDEYTTVLESVSDAEVYAGWARAAAILGHPDEARTAIQQSMDLAPGSVAFALEAASLAEAAGDAGAMRALAQEALAITNAAWDPGIRTARFVPGVEANLIGFAHPGDLGLFGASLGSSRDWLAVTRTPQGGGLLADVEVVPRVTDPARDQWRRNGLASDVAALTAVQASVALGDPETASFDFATWYYADVTMSAELIDQVWSVLRHHLWAAQVVADGVMPSDAVGDGSARQVFEAVDTTLRRAGEYERLEGVCQTLSTAEDDGSGYLVSATEALQCVGDSRMLRGAPEAAVAAYTDAISESRGAPPATLLIRRGAASLQTEPGSRAGRADLVRATTTAFEAGEEATALIVLAGDDLNSGKVAVAEAHYDLALDLLDIDLVDSDDQGGRAGVRQARVQALTNRGVARLRMAQDDPQQQPDCTASAHRHECRAAAADFDTALAIDPLNPITLMDRGWVERSSGRTALARAALGQATAADPSLFPAWNDLGVLAARAGDTAAARRSFRAALSASPRYALAWWNLGVLELRSGATGLRAGQADLAKAISIDSSLATAALEYRTDEAVYKATFGGLEEVSSSWPVSRTYGLGAAVLGGIGLISALGRLFRGFLGNLWGTITGLAVQRSSKTGRLGILSKLATAVSARLPRGLTPWAPWIAVAGVLAAVTTTTVALRDPSASMTTLAALAIATASALGVHVIAHFAMLRRHGGRLVADQWTGGILMAMLMVPAQASTGPYVGERVEDAPEERLVRIHVAGPIANLALAAVAYATFVFHPVPLLALTAQVSLAVAAYTLLPNEPLDGKVVVDRRPLLAAALTLLVSAAGAAFAVGVA